MPFGSELPVLTHSDAFATQFTSASDQSGHTFRRRSVAVECNGATPAPGVRVPARYRMHADLVAKPRCERRHQPGRAAQLHGQKKGILEIFGLYFRRREIGL